jgi:membrane-bound lytic murein transglycosylase A
MRELLTNPMLAREGDAYLNRMIRANFEVYQSIGAPDPSTGGYSGRVLFTGYFTPIYSASLRRTEEFKYPLYKRPADLVRNEATGDVLGRRMPDGSITPKYYSRTEIEQGKLLSGQELVWLKDRFDAYVIGVQGSARLRLPDGRIYEIGYAGHNGYDYTSPGEQMIKDGKISKQQLSLRGLKNYFAAHPQDVDKYLSLNKRFVFFAERPGGPFGSLNVPVTPFATIATDKAIYPRALPAFLWTKIPVGESGATREYKSILLDQDTGGAIRAAGRCDIYMGVGDVAERLAGHQLHEGKLYYFAVKPELVRQYLAPTAPRMPAP